MQLGSSKSVATTHQLLLRYWKGMLGLDQYMIYTERLSLFQVCDGYCRLGNSMVGVAADHDAKVARIYHTRQLKEDDIVHELLHVRHPSWSEEQVNRATKTLLAKKKRSFRINNNLYDISIDIINKSI
ncbi:MAG: hypothetical protein AB1351_02780 [Thermoproteota archaeon]